MVPFSLNVKQSDMSSHLLLKQKQQDYFPNGQTIISIRQALLDLSHPQPPTPLKTDNSTSNDFVHANMKRKRSKSWDMRYHWLHDRTLQQHLQIYWDRGSNNHADYFTKYHPPIYHKSKRSQYQQLNFMCTPKTKNFPLLRFPFQNLRTPLQGC